MGLGIADISDERRVELDTPEDTSRLAAAVARVLRAGDVLLLSGPIGAGKSHFARAVIQSRLALDGRPVEDVPSPTFTLVQTYEMDGVEIWHADLYRLTHPDEVEELGLIDAFDTAICLVEWPDRLGPLIPPQAIRLTFDVTGDTRRRLTLTGPAARLAALLQEDPN